MDKIEFLPISTSQLAEYVEYRSAGQAALLAHLRAVGSFARAEALGRGLRRLESRRRFQVLSAGRRGALVSRWVMRQAGALRSGGKARLAAGKLFKLAREKRAQILGWGEE